MRGVSRRAGGREGDRVRGGVEVWRCGGVEVCGDGWGREAGQWWAAAEARPQEGAAMDGAARGAGAEDGAGGGAGGRRAVEG